MLGILICLKRKISSQLSMNGFNFFNKRIGIWMSHECTNQEKRASLVFHDIYNITNNYSLILL